MIQGQLARLVPVPSFDFNPRTHKEKASTTLQLNSDPLPTASQELYTFKQSTFIVLRSCITFHHFHVIRCIQTSQSTARLSTMSR